MHCHESPGLSHGASEPEWPPSGTGKQRAAARCTVQAARGGGTVAERRLRAESHWQRAAGSGPRPLFKLLRHVTDAGLMIMTRIRLGGRDS